MVVGLLLCAAFVVISFSLGSQPKSTRALVKADPQVRTAGEQLPAN
jgi:hypothetical protein